MVSADSSEMIEAVWAVLNGVSDPEIPVLSIVDLGIVRSVESDRVTVTTTYTGCPATEVIERNIRNALDRAGYESVELERAIFPPWSTDWITSEGRAKLEKYGIAPPTKSPATCPQCHSDDVIEVSRFGSTPCKSMWRCAQCSEPFELFKCH